MSPKLTYPVLLVHGMGFRDDKRVGYWGRIPKELKSLGCQVFYGNQDSNADIETNGKFLAQRIDEIIRETGAEKVNIIAHSKGGLDSRYALEMVKGGDVMIEYDKLIDRQLERAAITSVAGFAKLFDGATQVLAV